MDHQRLQVNFEQPADEVSDAQVSASDGNILCESLNDRNAQSNTASELMPEELTQSPQVRNSQPAEEVLSKTDGFGDFADFPPMMATQTNLASSRRSEHSDDEVEVRRALEESETVMRKDLAEEPYLHRQSTHSLLH